MVAGWVHIVQTTLFGSRHYRRSGRAAGRDGNGRRDASTMSRLPTVTASWYQRVTQRAFHVPARQFTDNADDGRGRAGRSL